MKDRQATPSVLDQDLSIVLRRLNRVTPAGQRKAANDPVTKAYLVAGMRLIEQKLGPRTEGWTGANDDDDRSLLEWLSQRAVVAEVANNPFPLPKQGTTASLRDRWRSQSDFIADLLSFALRSQHYVGAHSEKIADLAEQIAEGQNIVDGIHSSCYWDLHTVLTSPSFRLQLLATVIAEQNQTIQEALIESYQSISQMWEPVNSQSMTNTGRRLRSGLTLKDFGYLLTALVEGLALRVLAEPSVEVADHEQQRTLFGTGCLALLLACTEPIDAPDGMTVEEFVEFQTRHSRKQH